MVLGSNATPPTLSGWWRLIILPLMKCSTKMHAIKQTRNTRQTCVCQRNIQQTRNFASSMVLC
jgi:hypothetical protein